MQSLLKSHYCRDIKNGQIVKLAGGVSNLKRIGKDLFFISLRDETGSVQVKFSDDSTSFKDKLNSLSLESVISIQGKVVKRPGSELSVQGLGKLEVEADQFTLLNSAAKLPFGLLEKSINEEIRLEFRHVDLRRPFMFNNVRKRQEVVRIVRRSLEDDFGFQEFETPLLFKSTPEGASEFLGIFLQIIKILLVEANDKGEFYALPQSPQQMKQILM